MVVVGGRRYLDGGSGRFYLSVVPKGAVVGGFTSVILSLCVFHF